MKTRVALWRVVTVIGLLLWILLAVLLGSEIIEAHLEGWFDRDSPMMTTIVEGGSSMTYADWYQMLVIMFRMMLLCIVTAAVSLVYQCSVLRTGSLLPNGKWLLPVCTVLLHIAVVVVWCIY